MSFDTYYSFPSVAIRQIYHGRAGGGRALDKPRDSNPSRASRCHYLLADYDRYFGDSIFAVKSNNAMTLGTDAAAMMTNIARLTLRGRLHEAHNAQRGPPSAEKSPEGRGENGEEVNGERL